ncbi:MAG: response regulator transcription factor [Cytophagales bacterium]|nr:response regulator transcription factor [Armatimonadota bacterium]
MSMYAVSGSSASSSGAVPDGLGEAAAAPVADTAAETVKGKKKGARAIKLTKREIEVLCLVIEGNSSKEVADQLYVSKRTVDFHLANIYHKLSVTNRVQAFREATRRGLIPFSIVGAGSRQ